MMVIECSTQGELDAALANRKSADEVIVCTGGTWERPLRVSGSASVRAYGSASVRASGSASVEASGSASVQAYDSASVRAYDSASVEAYDSASVRAYDSASVQAYDSASVHAYDSASVHASKYVAIHKHPDRGYGTPKISGGVIIELPTLDTPKDWLDYYGIPVERGIAVLYKAVDDTWGANHNGFKYEPGSKPAAPDWDSKPVCGGGLHFCARPLTARDKYHLSATRFVGCPVRVSEIVVIDETKVKAPRVARPVFEVDKHGDPVVSAVAA